MHRGQLRGEGIRHQDRHPRVGSPQTLPRITFIVANHRRYVIMHNRIVDAVGRVLPVENVMSIDEMSCRLVGDERKPEAVAAARHKIKSGDPELAGDYMRCSIGVGPNVMLAKVAADMQKPDGLTILADADMPAIIAPARAADFPGVGPRMERRLKLHGIFSVEQLCRCRRKRSPECGGANMLGERWYRLLHGEDVPDTPTRRQTVSHSHILPPELRTDEGAYGVLMRLVHKAAARMRKIDYWAGRFQSGEFSGPGTGRYGWGKRVFAFLAVRIRRDSARRRNLWAVAPVEARPAERRAVQGRDSAERSCAGACDAFAIRRGSQG